MDNKIRITRYVYYFSLASLIFVYLFPGSIFGFFLYSDLKQQPNIIPNPFGTSINHFFAFFYLSIVGLFAYLKDLKFKSMIFFFILLSILLELSHLFLPARSFQTLDLAANLLGTFFAIVIIFIYKKIKYGKI